MRGLRIALRKPLIGVTTLEAMAIATEAERAAAIHDAKRDEAYLLLWENGRVVLEPVVMDFAAALEKIKAFGPCALAGTGAPAAAAVAGRRIFPFARAPARRAVGRPAALWQPGHDAAPAPLYLRAPDAKLPASPAA